MTFDPTKPVQTRDGRKARIIFKEAIGRWPIIALVLDTLSPDERPVSYTTDGMFYSSEKCYLDLINIDGDKNV